MLHDVGNNRDCDVDVDHRNNTTERLLSCGDDLSLQLTAGNNPILLQNGTSGP